MRSGTTALAEALNRHAQIAMCSPKEPNYFATLHGALDYRGPGDQAFAAQNIASWERYRALFPTDPQLIGGEASAMYLALPDCAQDIATALPEVKVILLLRDPLLRAQSAYAYLLAQGREHAADFATGLAAEPERRSGGFGPIWWYRQASDYRAGLAAFAAVFPPDRLLLLTSEELDRAPAATMSTIFDFLAVSGDSSATLDVLTQPINTSRVPRNKALARVLYPPDPIRRAAYAMTPDPLVGRLRRWRDRMGQEPQGLGADLPAELAEEFGDIARSVQERMGRSLHDLWPSSRE